MKKIIYLLILLVTISFFPTNVFAKDKDLKTTFIDNLSNNGELVEDKGTYYIKGESPNNYLYYSGIMWRIINVDFENGALTILSDEIITSIAYNTDGSYIESDVRKWLNDTSESGFLGNLFDYKNNLVKTNWNGEIVLNENDIVDSRTIRDYVGLLSIYDVSKISGLQDIEECYLNIKKSYCLSNTASKRSGWYINERGVLNKIDDNNILGIRPVIKLKLKLLNGSGTKDDPYVVTKENKSTQLEKRSSGEYLLFNNELYRISYIRKGVTTARKITPIKNGNTYLQKSFSYDNSLFNPKDKDNIAYYLNNDYYKSLNLDSRVMLVYSDSNLGQVSYRDSYLLTRCKNVSCNSRNSTIKSRISLMEYASLMNSSYDDDMVYKTWLITPASTSQIYTLNSDSSISTNIMTDAFAITPTINLKKDIRIKSGTGSRSDPFVINLSNKSKNFYTMKVLVGTKYKIEDIFAEINYDLKWESSNKDICYVTNNSINVINNGACTVKTSGENYIYQINLEAINYKTVIIMDIILSLLCLVTIIICLGHIYKFYKKRS